MMLCLNMREMPRKKSTRRASLQHTRGKVVSVLVSARLMDAKQHHQACLWGAERSARAQALSISMQGDHVQAWCLLGVQTVSAMPRLPHLGEGELKKRPMNTLMCTWPGCPNSIVVLDFTAALVLYMGVFVWFSNPASQPAYMNHGCPLCIISQLAACSVTMPQDHKTHRQK